MLFIFEYLYNIFSFFFLFIFIKTCCGMEFCLGSPVEDCVLECRTGASNGEIRIQLHCAGSNHSLKKQA